MDELDPFDELETAHLRVTVIEYLKSGLVASSNIGRHYAVGDPKQRMDFAEWFVALYQDLTRYQEVTDPDEGSDDDDE